MDLAINEAKLSLDNGNYPVGAILVRSGEIVWRGGNRCKTLNDPSAHAEMMMMIRDNGYGLEECTLYVTMEPCIMCFTALCYARVGTIVYGMDDLRLGAITNNIHKFDFHHIPKIIGGNTQVII
jgi:tRNA(Arg) A34 adenosine deaminase TadA